MLKIAYISSEYPPETGYGGIGTYTKYIAEAMAERGNLVCVICASRDNLEKTYKNNGVNIYRVPYVSYPLPSSKYAYLLRRFFVKNFPHFLHRLCWSIAARKKLVELVKEFGIFDIIEYPECGGEGLLVSKRMCIKKIVRLHTSWTLVRKIDKIKEPIGDIITLPFIENLSIKRADFISAPSYAIVKRISKTLKIKKTCVIPNPLNIRELKRGCGEHWIFIGRVERIKGIHILIEAYANILKDFNPPQLFLIGRAFGVDKIGMDYGNYIRKIIREMKLDKKVKWIEGLELSEVYEYLSLSKVAFLPSLWENYPYVCLEAMASGCMVVASKCGGLPEIIINNENGLLINPNSVESLQEAMVYVLQNPEKVELMGKKARIWVEENINYNHISKKMEEFYYSVLKREKKENER